MHTRGAIKFLGATSQKCLLSCNFSHAAPLIQSEVKQHLKKDCSYDLHLYIKQLVKLNVILVRLRDFTPQMRHNTKTAYFNYNLTAEVLKCPSVRQRTVFTCKAKALTLIQILFQTRNLISIVSLLQLFNLYILTCIFTFLKATVPVHIKS